MMEVLTNAPVKGTDRVQLNFMWSCCLQVCVCVCAVLPREPFIPGVFMKRIEKEHVYIQHTHMYRFVL